jgi:hypothetical protein
MEHAKKLVLVDPRMLKPSMLERTLTKMDAEIANTLNSELDDYEKAHRYMNVLKKYKYMDAPKTNTKEKIIDKIEMATMDSAPPNKRHKAKRLFEQIKKDPSAALNEKGEFIYKQSLIPGSNITDLIVDALRAKSTEGPLGWKEFVNSLKETNVEKDLISNPATLKQLRKRWEDY